MQLQRLPERTVRYAEYFQVPNDVFGPSTLTICLPRQRRLLKETRKIFGRDIRGRQRSFRYD